MPLNTKINNNTKNISYFFRDRLFTAMVLLFSIVIGYFITEVGYRIWFFEKLRSKIITQMTAQFSSFISTSSTDLNSRLVGTSIFDPIMGFRYRPNIQVKLEKPWPVNWRTNRYGQVTDYDFPIVKPKKEYRIIVIGDSFTANVTNTVRWPDMLQVQLNRDPIWKSFVHNKFTRVINLGRDGIGIVQFPDVLQIDGLKFSPDLVIINFITDDIPRRPYFRGNLR